MSIKRMFLLFGIISVGNLLGMDWGPSEGDFSEVFPPTLAAHAAQPPQQALAADELDLTGYERINRALIESLGRNHPNVQRIIINAASTEREGYVGLTRNLADAFVAAFPKLKFIQILDCDFSQPLTSGLTRLSMLRTGDAKIVVEYTRKCEKQANK